ncbi:hypothetical protein SAMN05421504_104544 [Amycolatopsis xylanica]|uniref:Uncharacterized protein n=1 Tax=Amycolatopsis xylanica TaxID=589385 RepID=A0A1H3H7F4_9PSEU|nr:hypothetical protein [Amycolatopsis xylanica]SDY11270.1 hypothetical protein SAMN05421504_104544 [Amycolatopsis xylanica]
MDPILVGALIWLLDRLAGRGVDWLFDNAVGRGRNALAAPQVKRHDLTAPGAQATSDVDFTVRHHLAQTRSPVILTFQKFSDKSTGITLPMVLGDTAHVTLPRNHYFVTALIIDLPKNSGDLPTLRGLGWAQPFVADNHTAKITIATQQPTDALITKIGLKQADGSVPFRLPTVSAEQALQNWLAKSDIKKRYPLLGQKPTVDPKFKKFFESLDIQPQPSKPLFPRVPPSKATPVDWKKIKLNMCRAQAWVGTGRCGFLAHKDNLCKIHRDQIRNGATVLDHATGKRIVL